ncbi:hypothetical protein Poly24_23220 [Rosistilla carotiformis]|uniref:Cytochrome c domain-containing protein n=1 Tax=Rosistilla carotiformis TaxID=2528017 RepID=A0A518JSU9_9BACT|nr:SO2930 family diheme c-type cytochrome [Rosistilla carotiformis]QDV68612.1 hypothetical protein Poly24_23220 [Rosistilla carotiformis]
MNGVPEIFTWRSLPMLLLTLIALVMGSFVGCREATPVVVPGAAEGVTTVSTDASDSAKPAAAKPRRVRSAKYLQHLSQYALFDGPLADLRPASGTMPYDVNTPLFSDYAAKHRLIRMPEGTAANYQPEHVFDFPVGTVIAKTFYYPHDRNDPARGRRLIETRILLHQPSGWVGLPYLWDDAQQDATLSLTGGAVEVQWKHEDGKDRTNTHLVPNFNDCKRCHENQRFEPIGPKAGNLNREFDYVDGRENQLERWSRLGLLDGLPPAAQRTRFAVWDDESTGDLNARARAWLDVNCAHCHSAIGPARNSGLHLHVDVDEPYRLGVFKTPVAAGRGTGGRLYDIVPGQPDASILMHRLETDHVGEMMPEIGRSLVDQEGVALIRQWITELDQPQDAPTANVAPGI